MNLQNDPQSLALMKFGIGQPVLRTEDPILLRGAGRYTDDIKVDGAVYAVIVRSRVAHGIIKNIDTAAARQLVPIIPKLEQQVSADRGRQDYAATSEQLRRLITAVRRRAEQA